MPKKPRFIIFLIVLSIWSLLKSFGYLFNYQVASDYVILSHYNIGNLFFVYLYLGIILTIISLWFLFKPKIIGFYIIIAGLIIDFLYNLSGFYFASKDLTFAKETYVAGRMARGLRANEKSADFMFAVPGCYLVIAMVLIFTGVMIYYLVKERDYFYNKKDKLQV